MIQRDAAASDDVTGRCGGVSARIRVGSYYYADMSDPDDERDTHMWCNLFIKYILIP